MRHLYILSIGLMLLTFWGCREKIEVQPKNYPYLITSESTNVTDTSVQFNGTFLSLGDEEIIEYGFLWDTVTPSMSRSSRVILKSNAGAGAFSATVSRDLYPNTQEMVRGYARTSQFTVLGNVLEFQCNGGVPPEIQDVTPQKGYGGTAVVIRGKNFGNDPSAVRVYFGTIEATVDSCAGEMIRTKVPALEQDMHCKITVSYHKKTAAWAGTFNAYTYWQRIEDLPGFGRYGAMSFVLGADGYVCGGAKSSGVYLSDVYAYDSETGHWVQKLGLPWQARAFGVGCSLNGKGYVGFGTGEASYLRDLWEYDPAFNSWVLKANNNNLGTFGDASFAIDNHLYVYTATVAYVYEPTVNQFYGMSSFPGPYRYFTSSLTYGGQGYILGGQMPNNQRLNDFWCYSPGSDSWAKRESFPGGTRDGIAFFELNGYLYAGMGDSGGSMFKDFYRYDPHLYLWTRIENFPGNGRKLAVSFVIGNKAYVGCGRDSHGDGLSDFWEFDPNKIK